jgi:DNA-binding winged helix-turn-helix (wHTH) protein/alpha-beta hydrolase superfamily lysophospholipase
MLTCLHNFSNQSINDRMQHKFLGYVLNTEAHTLTLDGVVKPVEPQVFDLLHLLIKNAGTLVTKDQLIKDIWGGRIVSESAISSRITAARKAVGDDGKSQAIIRTVTRRGLQFVAELSSSSVSKPMLECLSKNPKIRYATADDGVKIAFSTSGSGPALFRSAHFPSHLELEWAETINRATFDELSKNHTLIRMDHRGSGLSDLDVDDFSTSRCAKDMKAVVEALGLDCFALFGSSSGAMVCVEFATMFPDSVSHLVTLGGYVDGRAVRDEALNSNGDEAILNMAKAGWETPDSAFVTGYLSVYLPTASPEKLKQLAHIMQNSCPVENEVRGREFTNRHSIAKILNKVKVPTLVLHCRGDAVHPLSEGQKLARGIPDAQLMILESRNHYPLPEEKDWHSMITSMLEFIKN